MKKIIVILVFFISLFSYSQGLPLEGFENTTGPEPLPSTNWTLVTGTWRVFGNGVGVGQRWGINNGVITPPLVYAGTNAAYMNRENIGINNTSEDYLVTPLIQNYITDGQLRFYTRSFTNGNQGTIYRVMVLDKTANPGLSETNPSSFSPLQDYTEDQLTALFNIYEEKVINLPATYNNHNIYIAFVMRFTQPTTAIGGDRWLIDNVRVVQGCPAPSNLSTTGITYNSANLNWTNPIGVNTWEIEIIPATSTPTGVPTVTYTGTLPYVIPASLALLPNTAYKYYVRSVCTNSNKSGWVSETFSTSNPCSFNPTFNDDNGASFNDYILNWTGTSLSTGESYQVAKVLCGSSPTNNDWTDMANPPNPSNPSYTFNNLIPGTCYSFFVRKKCANGYYTSPIRKDVVTSLNPPICGQTFTDTGGINGPHPVLLGAPQTTTISPAITGTGQMVSVIFSAFALGTNSTLKVYNGPSASSPLLGTYSGTTLPPVITASNTTGQNPTGKLTFVFTSGRVPGPGWIAEVSCCTNHLNIAENYTATVLTQLEAQNTITAANTIPNDFKAIYHAGDWVLLSNGFYAINGSYFHGYIQACSNNFLYRSANTYSENNSVYEEDIDSNRNTIEEIQGIKIAPNPNNGSFKIGLNSLTKGTVEIVNLTGTVVYQTTFNDQKEIEINMQEKATGFYIIKISTEKQNFIEKFIKN